MGKSEEGNGTFYFCYPIYNYTSRKKRVIQSPLKGTKTK
jgi:hypothetical protein